MILKHLIWAVRVLLKQGRNSRASLLVIVCAGQFQAVVAQPYIAPSKIISSADFAVATVDQFELHYAYSGAPDQPGLMFVHGTPGSWHAFDEYLADPELQQEYFMVAIDRLGWGQSANRQALQDSGLGRNKLRNFALQAKSIATVMERYPHKKWLIIGHSLGASIAPKVALHYPHNVSGLLLLAGSLGPQLGKARWYNRAASMILVKWMLPSSLKYSNEEIMALSKELQSIETELQNKTLATEVVVIQGMKDRLVSPKNSAYAQQQWQHKYRRLRIIELADAGHFLPWKQGQLIRQTIREFSF